jgi:poly(A) polymerase
MEGKELIYKTLKIVRNYAKSNHLNIYIVGGFIRDYLIGKELKDIDLLIYPLDYKFLFDLTNLFNGKLIKLDEEREYYRIIINNKDGEIILDFTPIYENNLLLEVLRRDFTINSIVLDLLDFKIIDPLNGLKDLERGILRLSSPNSFKEDPLRILRAFRFLGYGFKIEKFTYEKIIEDREKLKSVKAERIHDELYKIMNLPFSSYLWIKMVETKVLEVILPELFVLKDTPWSDPHHEDPLMHSISSLSALEDIIYNIESIFPDIHQQILTYLNEKFFSNYTKLETLKLAVLLHDIGKSKTFSIDEFSLVHYYGHSQKGVELLDNIGERLKLSKKEIIFLKKLIGNHMYPINFIQNPVVNPIYKLILRVKDDVPGLILLFMADQISIKGTIENLDWYRKILNEFFKIKNTPKPLLTGNEIMEIFNLKPSPLIGKLKEKLIEAQINNKISTREEAIKYIEEILKNEANS